MVIPPGGSSLVITDSESERACQSKKPISPVVVAYPLTGLRREGERAGDAPTKTEPTKTEFRWNKLVKSLIIYRDDDNQLADQLR